MSDKPKILVVGAEFSNQGAYLMLVATVQSIRERFGAIPVLEHTVGSVKEKKRIGALRLVPHKVAAKIQSRKILRLVSLLTGSVSPDQIDAVFDASGFRYGDQWKALDLAATAARLSDFAQRGTPVYMLPQAFGPFDETSGVASEILQASRMIFARDPVSTSFIKDFAFTEAEKARVRTYPDFTGPLSGSMPESLKELTGAIPIIPNWNIRERAVSEQAIQYVMSLARMVDALVAKGHTVYGLSHEGAKDTALLEEVARECRTGLRVVSGLDGVQLKGLIAGAPLVVSGRYHAIASALSQGVPVLAHGWSHKYQWLLADYGVPELLVDPYSPPEVQVSSAMSILADESVRGRITSTKPEVADRTETMWQAISEDFSRLQGDKAPNAFR